MRSFVIFAFGVGLAASPLSAAEPAAKPQVKALEDHMQKVIDDATPTVVGLVISTAKYPGPAPTGAGKLGGFTPPRPLELGMVDRPEIAALRRLDLSNALYAGDHQSGSGIVLDADRGLILTTYHLIDGATKIYVRTSSGKGSYADIVAADARSDLAVLRTIFKPTGMASASFATVRLVAAPDGTKPNLKRGSWVIALGHPLGAGLGDGQPSASWGILSNVRRRSAPQPQREELRMRPLHQYGSLLQTDARVTLGSSGSALLNMDGEVVGMASSVAAVSGSEASGGFAVPIDANFRRIIDVLKKGEEVEYGFLGVAPITSTEGVMIGSVTPGCPAQIKGLQDRDVIRAVDGYVLSEPDDLLLHVGAALAGTPVTLTISRNKREFDVVVPLAKVSNSLASLATVTPSAVFGLRVEYSSVRFIQLFNLNFRDPSRINTPVGVAVRDLEPRSPAEKRFAADDLQNWIITKVDNAPVAVPVDFYKAAEGKSSIKLTLADPTAPSKLATVTLP